MIKIEIGDKITVRDTDINYGYEELLRNSEVCHTDDWQGFVYPTVGKEYTVIFKSKCNHLCQDRESIVYVIVGDDGMFVINDEIVRENFYETHC